MEVPSGASFSYFVSLDVLKTPFIFTAVSIEQKTEVTQMLTYIYIYRKRERERERSLKSKDQEQIQTNLNARTRERNEPET